MNTIKHTEYKHNGRRVILDTCELAPGKYETMLLRITKVITRNGLDAVVHFFPDTVLSYSLRVSVLKLFNLPPGSRTCGGTY